MIILFLLVAIAQYPFVQSAGLTVTEFAKWGSFLSAEFDIISENLCSFNLQSEYSSANWENVDFNSTLVLNELALDIKSRFEHKVLALQSTKQTYEYMLTDDPESNSFSGDMVYCEDVSSSDTSYDPAFLGRVDPDSSCLKLPWYVKEDSSTIKRDVRVTKSLDESFRYNSQNYPALKWQYVGTTEGLFRIFPAKEEDAWHSRGYEPEDNPSTAFITCAVLLPLGFLVIGWCLYRRCRHKAKCSKCKQWHWVLGISLAFIIPLAIFLPLHIIWPNNIEPYDARLRPWYSATAAIPKDVVLLIDTSGSMSIENRMQLAKRAAVAVLKTLTPDDYIAVIDFDDRIRMPPKCFNNNMAPATPQNIALLDKFVNDMDGLSGGTNFEIAFDKAFSLISSSGRKSRQPVILFLTDGEAEVPSDLIGTKQANLQANGYTQAKIFCYALGGAVPDTVITKLEQVANGNSGAFFHIPDGGDLRSVMGQYYSNPGLVVTKDTAKNVTYSVPYFDASGLGLVMTVASPLFNSNDALVGIAGADVSVFDALSQVALAQLGPLSYSFLIDSTGRVLIHPLLPLPTSFEQSPIFLDISQLETAPGFDDIRTSMLAGETSSSSLESTRVLPVGESKQGGKSLTFNMTYYWKPVPTLPFHICIVIAEDDLDIQKVSTQIFADSNKSPVSIQNYYHRIDIDSAPGTHYISPYPDCLDPYGDTNLTTEVSTWKAAPKAFREPYLYLQDGDYDIDPEGKGRTRVRNFNELFNSNTTSSRESIESIFLPNIPDDVYLTSRVEQCWLNTRKSVESYALYRYVGTENGVFRVYPGHPFQKEYDASRRPWYYRAESNPERYSLSTYLDASFGGQVTTMSKPIKSPLGRTVAVIGIDFLAEHVKRLLKISLSKSGAGGAQYDEVMLLDYSGYLIYHHDMTGNSVFITELEPAVGDGLYYYTPLYRGTCNNYQDLSVDHYFRYDNPALTFKDAQLYNLGGCGVYIMNIESANVLLLVRKHKSNCGNSNAQCPVQDYVSTLYPGKKSSAVLCDSVFPDCPCSSEMNYNPCTDVFYLSAQQTCPPIVDPLPPFGDPMFCFAWWKIFLCVISGLIAISIGIYVGLPKTRERILQVYTIIGLIIISPLIILTGTITALCLIPQFITSDLDDTVREMKRNITSNEFFKFLVNPIQIGIGSFLQVLLLLCVLPVYAFFILIMMTYYRLNDTLKSPIFLSANTIFEKVLFLALSILISSWKLLRDIFFIAIALPCAILSTCSWRCLDHFTELKENYKMNEGSADVGYFLSLISMKHAAGLFVDILCIPFLLCLPLTCCSFIASIKTIFEGKTINQKRENIFVAYSNCCEQCGDSGGNCCDSCCDATCVTCCEACGDCCESCCDATCVPCCEACGDCCESCCNATCVPCCEACGGCCESCGDCCNSCCEGLNNCCESDSCESCGEAVINGVAMFCKILSLLVLSPFIIAISPLVLLSPICYYVDWRSKHMDGWKWFLFPYFAANQMRFHGFTLETAAHLFKLAFISLAAVIIMFFHELAVVISLFHTFFMFIFTFGFRWMPVKSFDDWIRGLHTVIIVPLWGFWSFVVLVLPILFAPGNWSMFWTKGLFYSCSEAEISDGGCDDFWKDSNDTAGTTALMVFWVLCHFGLWHMLFIHITTHYEHLRNIDFSCFKSSSTSSTAKSKKRNTIANEDAVEMGHLSNISK